MLCYLCYASYVMLWWYAQRQSLRPPASLEADGLSLHDVNVIRIRRSCSHPPSASGQARGSRSPDLQPGAAVRSDRLDRGPVDFIIIMATSILADVGYSGC
jgi:hypothetical protein